MSNDEKEVFTAEELRRAMELIVPEEEAAEISEILYHDAHGPPLAGSHEYWSEDTLDLLSLVSDACAEKVRVLLKLDRTAAAKRREDARRRLGL